jgi:hypothetical protein
VAETNDPAPVAEPTAADRAMDLRGHYAELERLRPQCDPEWCPFLNPTPQMDQWQTAIRRALYAEAALRAAREEAGLAAERLDALLDRMNAVQSALGIRVTDGTDGDPVAWAAAVKRQADQADALRARLAAADAGRARVVASLEEARAERDVAQARLAAAEGLLDKLAKASTNYRAACLPDVYTRGSAVWLDGELAAARTFLEGSADVT